MGNKLGRRRQVVDEKYTRPQGLYNHKDVDHKKLRKLILESKLAPCYPGDEESTHDREECPICFLYYPSLNRSRCCMKSICTECFLQMKVPNSTRPTQYPASPDSCLQYKMIQLIYSVCKMCFFFFFWLLLSSSCKIIVFLNHVRCPFCKTANYAVEYRGVKSKEEKGLEQIEEQRVIEAKIRMHQQELMDEEERINKRQEISSSNENVAPMDVGYSSNAAAGSSISVVEGEEIIASQDSCAAPMARPPPAARANRDDEFDIDLEDIMVMEAIWLSIQNGSSSSPSGGLACAIAALAERQQVGGESSMSSINGNTPSFNMPQEASGLYSRLDRDSVNYLPADNLHEIPPNETMVMTRGHGEWGMGHVAQVAGAAIGYGGSVAAEDSSSISSLSLRQLDDTDGSIANATDPIVPESFEEQMMLAMAVSLAEARAVSSGQGSSWQ